MNYFSQMKIFKTLIGQEIFFFLTLKKEEGHYNPITSLEKKVKALTSPTF